MDARDHSDISGRLAKYEAAIARLESIRGDYMRRKPLYAKGFTALTLAGFACFAFGGFAGLWGSISATFISVTGYIMVGIRIKELTKEISELQADMERMRRSAP